MAQQGPDAPHANEGRNLNALMAKAQTALTANELDPAETLCKEALRLSPNFPPANYFLAVIATRRGQSAAAIPMLRSVVNSDPNAFEALEWLTNLLREQGELKESLYLSGHMLRMRPSYAGSSESMGLCLVEKDQVSEALPYLETAVNLAPNVPVFHFNLALTLEKLGLVDRAVDAYRKAIELAPEIAAPYEHLGVLLATNDRRSEAISVLRDAVRAAPTRSSLNQLASALAEDDNPFEAEKFAREAVELDDQFAPSHEILGMGLQVLGRFDEARACFLRASELDPTMVGPYFRRTRTKRISEDDRELITKLEALAFEPGHSQAELRQVYYGLGKAYDDLGHYEQAMRHFQKANEMSLATQFHGQPFDLERHRRWIDRLIGSFNEKTFSANRALGSRSSKPIFIVGMIRSGTTLTEQILSSHPEVAAGGEIKYWTDTQRTNLILGVVSGLTESKVLQETASEYLQSLDLLSNGRSKVTDKMPLNYLSLGLIHLLLPEAKIIHCRRSPIDTCLSIYMTPFDKGAEFCYEPRSIIGAYQEYLRLMAHWRSLLPPESLLEIDYEELVADREGVTRRMLDFCNLEWDDACLRHEANERGVRTPSRWQVRQPVYSTSVERWRRYEPWLGEFNELVPPGQAP